MIIMINHVNAFLKFIYTFASGSDCRDLTLKDFFLSLAPFDTSGATCKLSQFNSTKNDSICANVYILIDSETFKS